MALGRLIATLPFVVAGLVPAIHVFDLLSFEDVDARDKARA
jgi:hypothetical protein